jgi:hypothetical protein
LLVALANLGNWHTNDAVSHVLVTITNHDTINGTYWDLSCLVGSLGESRRLAMMLLAMCWLQLPITTQLMALTGTCLAFLLLVALANLGDWQ